MILGLATPLTYRTPEEWARKHRELGCKAVVFPIDCTAPESEIEAFHKAAMQEGLVIAEVGIWKNVLSADQMEREQAVAYSINQLRMADKIGALCCVNIVGTPHGPVWDGAYAGNFFPETWDMIVKSIQHIIDEAAPRHTKFAIEPMPWMVPSSPDEYLKLIEDVDREAFGVHMDTGFHHFSLRVENIMEAARELDTKGIKLYNSPTWQNDLVTDPLDVGKQQCGSLAFYIHDPEGNEIEIVQYTADSRQLKCRG